MTSLLMLILAAAVPSPRPISDAELVRIAASRFDPRQRMFHQEVLGVNRGMVVVADYPCGDVCPQYTVRIIHYDREPGPGCEAAGGVTVERTVPRGIAVRRISFCVPRAVARH